MTLFCLPLQAVEYTMDPDLYQQALREVQGGAPAAQEGALNDEALEWQASMSLLGSEQLEQRWQGKLALLQLLKRKNALAGDEALAALITLHEQAASGELKACMRLGLALLRGGDGDLVMPKSVELALPYFEMVQQSLLF